MTFRQFANDWLERAGAGWDRRRDARFTIACVILRHLHTRTLRAAIRLPDLAREAGLGIRTTRAAVDELERGGLLRFERGNGRGNWSVFRPQLRRPVVITREGRA